MNIERVPILGSLNGASIEYRNIGSDGSMYLLNEIANIADQTITDFVRDNAIYRFFDMLRSDYMPKEPNYDTKDAMITVDLVALAKHLNATTSQTIDWLMECGKVELVITTPLHKATMPMIIPMEIAEKNGCTECQARIIIKALLLFLYKCPYDNSDAIDFLITD